MGIQDSYIEAIREPDVGRDGHEGQQQASRDRHRTDPGLYWVPQLHCIALSGERLTFDITGMTRLAGACPVDGRVRRHAWLPLIHA